MKVKTAVAILSAMNPEADLVTHGYCSEDFHRCLTIKARKMWYRKMKREGEKGSRGESFCSKNDSLRNKLIPVVVINPY